MFCKWGTKEYVKSVFKTEPSSPGQLHTVIFTPSRWKMTIVRETYWYLWSWFRYSGYTSHCETCQKQPSSRPCNQRWPAIKFGQCQKFGTISQRDCWCDQCQLTTHNWCLWYLILEHWRWCCRLRDLVCIFFVQPADSQIHDMPKFLGSMLYSVASCELWFFFKSQCVASLNRKNGLIWVCLHLYSFSAHFFNCSLFSHFSAILTGQPIIFSS